MSKSAATFNAMRIYGVPKSIVQHIAVNNFQVHPNYVDCFSKYFLLYWSGAYLLRQIKSGCITKDGEEYIVVYHNTTRGQVLNNPDCQFALSFRKAQDEFQVTPYVLIS